MNTCLSLPYEHETDIPMGYDPEVRTPPDLVRRFLSEYTDQGDRVFDPFTGIGTTLTVAEELGRVPYGVEYEPDLVEHVRGRLDTNTGAGTPSNRVRQGDVLAADLSWGPDCACVFTSPPFMEQTDTRNPFENYTGESDYETYLDDIETAFTRVRDVLEPGAAVVVDVSNLKHEGRVTTLAWDVADRLSTPFSFKGEVVVTWESSGEERSEHEGTFGYGYDHSYCLVFRNRSGE